ncbi:uL30 family ribosomal protein [Candidatus Woesearchaeota archaeon]|nr:uL30 family ribosomal protein [Candidatus Woesearchaeota archaeon]
MSEEKQEKKQVQKKSAKIALVRIKGNNKISQEKRDTLDMLGLYKKNYCVVLEKTPSIMGMVKKIEDLVTWGEVSDSTSKELKEKRGEKTKKKGKEELKKFFRLCPPKGGFERKGIKVPFSIGGALGYRGDKINDLIKRML